jgi:Na+/melibiose symporter-like transporter
VDLKRTFAVGRASPLRAFFLLLGAIYGGMFVLHPTWDASVGTYRLLITPDRLQGRVQSVNTLLSAAAVPLAVLVIGVLLEAVGSTATVVGLAALMALVAACALASRAVRDAPPLADSVEPFTEGAAQ